MLGSGGFTVLLAVDAHIIDASTMWLSVLLAWIGVRWFDAGMGWVWTAFVLTSAPASILVWWMFRQRIREYERGRRELQWRPPPSVIEPVSHHHP
jgi:membrane protein implicated in regulation of membrane protease activity